MKAQALSAALRFEPDNAGPIAKLVRRSAELDALQLGLQKTVTSSATDLSVVYLPGLDIVQHTLLGEQASGAAASTLSERLAAIEALLRDARRSARMLRRDRTAGRSIW